VLGLKPALDQKGLRLIQPTPFHKEVNSVLLKPALDQKGLRQVNPQTLRQGKARQEVETCPGSKGIATFIFISTFSDFLQNKLKPALDQKGLRRSNKLSL